MLFEGRCNTEVFNQWLEQMLLPELTAGSVMVLDKATFHTSKRTQELVEQESAVRCCLWLPVGLI
jgi:transposase